MGHRVRKKSKRKGNTCLKLCITNSTYNLHDQSLRTASANAEPRTMECKFLTFNPLEESQIGAKLPYHKSSQ